MNEMFAFGGPKHVPLLWFSLTLDELRQHLGHADASHG